MGLLIGIPLRTVDIPLQIVGRLFGQVALLSGFITEGIVLVFQRNLGDGQNQTGRVVGQGFLQVGLIQNSGVLQKLAQRPIRHLELR